MVKTKNVHTPKDIRGTRLPRATFQRVLHRTQAQCEVCGLVTRKGNLSRHLQLHHKVCELDTSSVYSQELSPDRPRLTLRLPRPRLDQAAVGETPFSRPAAPLPDLSPAAGSQASSRAGSPCPGERTDSSCPESPLASSGSSCLGSQSSSPRAGSPCPGERTGSSCPGSPCLGSLPSGSCPRSPQGGCISEGDADDFPALPPYSSTIPAGPQGSPSLLRQLPPTPTTEEECLEGLRRLYRSTSRSSSEGEDLRGTTSQHKGPVFTVSIGDGWGIKIIPFKY